MTSPIVTAVERTKQKTRTLLANLSKVGAGMALGTLLGMAIRDRQFMNHRYTYTDVVILTRFTPRDFDVWPDRMRQQRVTICAESSVDWHEGELLADWTFEQMQGCKRVISYHERTGGNIDAGIQMR